MRRACCIILFGDAISSSATTSTPLYHFSFLLTILSLSIFLYQHTFILCPISFDSFDQVQLQGVLVVLLDNAQSAHLVALLVVVEEEVHAIMINNLNSATEVVIVELQALLRARKRNGLGIRSKHQAAVVLLRVVENLKMLWHLCDLVLRHVVQLGATVELKVHYRNQFRIDHFRYLVLAQRAMLIKDNTRFQIPSLHIFRLYTPLVNLNPALPRVKAYRIRVLQDHKLL